ncbi:DUF4886 domain-containing protein [Sphingobacterium olei]|uniref:DUF4886 domain-containing protein n=1 Tax=Sphingobacterium olei TaxID=2571155 RepID=A0A4U0NGX2_9SPHI|nr:DUF4886 domain-containing protein [Sphingobacterium olei]TJZ53223.1 DUF4886 domain-containing protein [Sphingobacterium olei]
MKKHIYLALVLLICSIGGIALSSSCQKMERPEMNIIPDPADDGTIRVLTIGNSFSEDAVENYLYDLAKAEDIPIVIGNLYIGGAPLEIHQKNVMENNGAYSFRKIDRAGNKTTVASTSIATALASERWTHISFQQESSNSGMYDSWVEPLPIVYDYVAARATKNNPDVKFLLHQTWAYAQNSTHTGFANYGNNQMAMYEAIIDAVNRAKELVAIDLVVPAGTAIQNGRTSVVEDNFTRDGYHLNLSIGRYTAACTWFEALIGKSAIGNSFKPTGMSDFEAEIAQNAAHTAITKPLEVTPMTDFQGGNSGPLESAVLLDFGNNLASENWNHINSFLAGTRINLKDSLGSYVGIALEITERFNGVNADGPSSSEAFDNMPSNVSKYSYFGNSKGPFNGITVLKSVFDISGLDPNLTYNLCFFGSRGGVSDNRETKYTSKGTNEVSVSLNTSNNVSNKVCANGITPNAEGTITVTVTSGENNTNGSGFYYLSAARLTSN